MNMINDPFRKYRDVNLALQADREIRTLRDSIQLQQQRLAELEKPYQDELSCLEDEIKAIAIEQGETVERYGVKCSYSERRSTSWKSVAMVYDPPESLVDQHTKVSKLTSVKFVG